MLLGHTVFHIAAGLQDWVSDRHMRRMFGAWCAILFSAAVTACGNSDVRAAEDAARAMTLLEQGNLADARKAISDAIAERDDLPNYHILRGRIELAANSIPAAFKAYHDAHALEPRNVEALRAVSQLGLRTGQLRESLEATEALLALFPNDETALLSRGLHSMIRSRFDEAEGYADRILEANPVSEGGAILKARTLSRKGRSQDALEVLDRYNISQPATEGIALTRLEIYRANRDAAGLEEQFRILRTLVPHDTDIQIDRANFSFKRGRSREGLVATVAALSEPALSAADARSITELWSEYSVSRIPAEAVDQIASGGSVNARFAVSEFLARNGQFAAARRLSETLPNDNQTAIKGLLAMQAGRTGEAAQLASRVLQRDESHCLALTVQGEALLAANDDAHGALRSAQRAASQCPADTAAWVLAAKAYSALGDPENARRMWRQGIDANPQNSRLASGFIDWLLRSGRDREAVAVGRRLTHDAPALMSGWRLYLETCEATDEACVDDALRGLEDAKSRYGIDLLPGEAPPNGLFGRLVAR